MTSPQNLSAILDRLTAVERALLLDDSLFAIDDAVRKGTLAARSLLRRGLIHAQLSPVGIEAQKALREGTRP